VSAPRPVRLYESAIPSGNAYKVSLALAQLGLAREVEVIGLDILADPPETRRPEFLAKNPRGRIPVLELDDGTCLAESNAILCYLAEGTPLLPDDRLARARALAWMFFEQNNHEPFVAGLHFWTRWGGLHNKRPDELATLTSRGQAAIGIMDAHLARHPWFTGAQYGIADIALFAYTQKAEWTGFDVPASVRGWLERVRAQPGFVPIRP
jgi:glutathione S-transferase